MEVADTTLEAYAASAQREVESIEAEAVTTDYV